jgi:hypothetical protein
LDHFLGRGGTGETGPKRGVAARCWGVCLGKAWGIEKEKGGRVQRGGWTEKIQSCPPRTNPPEDSGAPTFSPLREYPGTIDGTRYLTN